MQLFLFLLVFAADQISKFYIQRLFAPGESRPVIDGIFHITRHSNTGAAFGLFEQGTSALIFFSLLFIGFTFVYLWRTPARDPFRPALSLILGGAVGNAVDRIRLGHVVDFLDFRVWPIFNVADAAITAGVGLILLTLFLRRKHEIS